MKCFASILLVIAATTLVPAAWAQADKAERSKLQGTWEGWLVQGDGSQQSQRQQRISELVITATEIRAKDGGNKSMGAGSYRLGTSGAAKTIDNTGTGGDPMGKSFMGIYRLDGDTLKW